ncbi:MAG: single-stranded DNA-binding protein [Candidatus Eisenbacteria bacterium]|uniref:Single-stranded DNA-binding protein n=1 Tax=Eiseniibacteriota bacterium TaxID=2212470 RepID=A0A948RVT1_UNCEI|nr:single-stranded DNA-binding protein [Candidatus Eisenbacteria bacterium]MBU2691785.1 single-stranded DNA-binding protein [Candidatus Eisenbacteria bacterium]
MSYNKVILIGNLGRDPELRHTPGGSKVANFTMATNAVWIDRDGQKQQRTEWHRIVVWGKQAETASEYLKKGRQTFVEGRLQTRKWTDNQNVERQTTEIVADRIVFLGQRGDAGAGGGYPSDGGYQSDSGGYPADAGGANASASMPEPVGGETSYSSDEDDDLPF